jgi:glycosyltransferase involved in cell wall biosynthesis
MRIVIPSIQVPFIRGGANQMVEGLARVLKQKGHQVEIVTVPFKFFPERDVEGLVDFWMNQDFNSFNGYEIDKVIVLQFPAYYVRHRNKTLWLMHQYRAVYDLYHAETASDELNSLKDKIHQLDSTELKKYKIIYTISKTVSHRLEKYNGIHSIHIYHPPYGEDRFYCEEPYNYIFYPSRLELHKRQDLLIKAMKFTKTPVVAIIAGIGGQEQMYSKLIEDWELKSKVKLIGAISDEEKYTLYARALAIFFGPFNEDYGYVTLEAMLSEKPVITCTDSGGPLEFINNQENGFIVEPSPEFVAEKIDWFYNNRPKAKEMGKCGLDSYKKKNINWENVVEKLLYS